MEGEERKGRQERRKGRGKTTSPSSSGVLRRQKFADLTLESKRKLMEGMG